MNKVINIRIIIAFSLVVLFFCGGVFLDYTAAQRWISLSPSDTESNKAMVEFAKDESAHLDASAKLLYDFAKITLGVLLTLLAASHTVAKASQAVEPKSEAKRDEPNAK